MEKVEELLRRKSGKEKLAFVGDGINDAPVLSRADIGIAMGAMGSDAAIEAADVVLMDDDPLQIPKAIRISRKCLRIVYQNIVFCHRSKADLPCSRRRRHCQYVAGHLCRCGRDDHRGTQCDPGAFCPETVICSIEEKRFTKERKLSILFVDGFRL